jgi:hypothetical protein
MYNDLNFAITMCGLAGVAFVQNMAFTAVSRSRNSGDVLHHAKWSVASNGVWFVTQLFMWGTLWKAVETSNYWQILVAFVVYVGATTFGSCFMMQHMLKTETGKRRVGAS